jgi:hypothetical protein
MTEQGPGLQDAIQTLTRVRDQLDADTLVAHWGPISVVIDKDGFTFFHDQDPVPMKNGR